MKKIILFGIIAISSFQTTVFGQTASTDQAAKQQMQTMQRKLQEISNASVQNKTDIKHLKEESEKLDSRIDSFKNAQDSFENRINETTKTLSETKSTVNDNQSKLSQSQKFGVLFALIIVIFVLCFLFKGKSSLDELQKDHKSLTIELDNKLLNIAEKKLSLVAPTNGEIDHSLTIKVADELVRIETNLSHMDASVKGYKQLSKAVQRIKDNFNANGYEIVDMLGKPFNDGMKAKASFITDESLEGDQKIITKIIKPQINYQGKAIQIAQIEVSQAE